MPKIEGFGQTKDVSVTILVDNHADLMVESTKTVKYFADAPPAGHGSDEQLQAWVQQGVDFALTLPRK